VSEVGLAQAAVAGPAASGDGDGLADGAFDAGSALVVLLPVLVLLSGADGGLQFVHLAGQDGQLPAVPGGFGAQLARRAGPAVQDAEPDDDLVVALGADGSPAGAGLALGAGDGAGVVVDGERGPVIALAGAGLPGGISAQRGDQGDPELAGRVQHGTRRGISAVEVLPSRGQVPAGQRGDGREGHLGVGDGRGGGRHAGDQVRRHVMAAAAPRGRG